MEERKQDMRIRARKLQIYLFIFLATVFLIVMFLNTTDLSGIRNEKLQSSEYKEIIINLNHTIEEGYIPLTEEEKYVLSEGIVLTREYQMKVDSKLFLNRTKGIEYYIEGLYQHFLLPEFLITRPDAATVRFQYNIDTHKCGKSYSARARHYYTGFMENKTTIDIKSSTSSDKPEDGQEKVYHKEFTPSAAQLNTSMQKFEADVHPCHIKWSRESRVYNVPFNVTLNYCYELTELFPQVKALPGKENEPILIGPDFQAWVWELEHTGFTKAGTKFKSAFTLQYDTFEEALEGTTIPLSRRGEWSMRIWSSHSGKGQWLESEILYFDAAYINSLFYFGSPDLPCASPSPMISLKFPLPHN